MSTSDRAWPADWAQRLAGTGCSMCAGLGRGDNEHIVAVAQLPFADEPVAEATLRRQATALRSRLGR